MTGCEAVERAIIGKLAVFGESKTRPVGVLVGVQENIRAVVFVVATSSDGQLAVLQKVAQEQS